MTGREPAAVARPVERRASLVRRVPSLFLAHGSPMSVLDREYARSLRAFASKQTRLRAIVVVSAHWRAAGPLRVTSHPKPSLIYDFTGLPGWLYEIAYPCPGDRAVAQMVAVLLERGGFEVRLDPGRGLDHGAWVPLSVAFPEASVPVVQLSMPVDPAPATMIAMGRALGPLRSEHVLLVGSGGITHNPSRVLPDEDGADAQPWASEFDAWVRERVGELDVESLGAYRHLGPRAGEAAPTSEHFDPLLFTLGTALPGDVVYDIHEGFRFGSLSMRCFALTGRRREDRGF
ncbi:MAG TPA: class III extradiol ring-cleavage dioxygenase [Vicinamibacterales bacterium]|nr:class III extradiol ring-cleavage dioxygenase [Vicinamibacterales bacterium]HPK72536.1 class III extradiol ring-cleavage dioxygenase [Vicinamibacterales bacterium]